jgi:hypothetical protein
MPTGSRANASKSLVAHLLSPYRLLRKNDNVTRFNGLDGEYLQSDMMD